MQHPDEGIIHAWIDDGLPADEAAIIAAHVASCEACAAATAEARGLISASTRIISSLDATSGNVLPTFRAKPRRRWVTAGVPGAIAAALLIGIGFYSTANKRREQLASSPAFRVPVSADTALAGSTTNQLMMTPPSPEKAKVARSGAARAADASVAGGVGGVATTPPTTTAPASADALPAPMITPSAPPSMSAAKSRPVTQSAAAPEPLVQLRTRAVPKGVGALAANRTREAAIAAVRADTQNRFPFTPTRTQAMSAFADEPRGGRAFIGCYELNNSTDVLPMRFALVADSAGAGLSQVRYLDSAGTVAERIADAAWSIENGRAVIRTFRRGPIMSLVRIDTSVVGETVNGPRTGRITGCR